VAPRGSLDHVLDRLAQLGMRRREGGDGIRYGI
jgi:hypothetical protein